MKKTLILTAVLAMVGFAASAQNYMVVNSEKVFRSIASYNNAVSTVDKLAEQYQSEIDADFAAVEKMYNDYMQQKPYLSEANRTTREDAIINRERQINERQEEIFGEEGELVKKRVELIKPIQDRVFDVINKYAESNRFQLVLDIASNPTVLYYSPAADRTEQIINLVK